MSEREVDLLAWLADRPETAGLLGDDTARLPDPAPRTVTVDSQIEGVHFPTGDRVPPEVIARRLLAVNVSDLAAAGARPHHAFLALSAPREFPHRRFFTAFLNACREADIVLAGGDLARHPERLVATLTLLGEPPAGHVPLGRGAGAPGHRLWVGGSLGESALGQRVLARGARVASPGGQRRLRPSDVLLPDSLGDLATPLRDAARRAVVRHLEPTPQLPLGLALGTRAPESGSGAVMDVSDGLALDLRRLCDRSGVGALVRYEDLPRAPRFEALCAALREDPAELLLGGGEDYLLLFTLPEGETPPSLGSGDDSAPARPIGWLTDRKDALVLERNGAREPWPDTGWDHLAP